MYVVLNSLQRDVEDLSACSIICDVSDNDDDAPQNDIAPCSYNGEQKWNTVHVKK